MSFREGYQPTRGATNPVPPTGRSCVTPPSSFAPVANSNPLVQMAEFRALINARRTDDQALWHELGDLLHSVFDSLDGVAALVKGLQRQIDTLALQVNSQADAIEARGRAITQIVRDSRGGNAESPTT